MTRESDALARLELAVRANREVGKQLDAVMRDQERTSDTIRAALLELIAYQQRIRQEAE